MKINAFSEPAKLYTGTQAGADEVLRTGRINMFRALRKYRLSPLPVHLDLFKSSDSTIYIANRENYGWKKYAKNGLTVHALPGDHSQIFAPPNDTRFAEILDKRLSELEQNQNPRIDNPVLK
jgi:thioesterase domain-containing protein